MRGCLLLVVVLFLLLPASSLMCQLTMNLGQDYLERERRGQGGRKDGGLLGLPVIREAKKAVRAAVESLAGQDEAGVKETGKARD
jgi:hypothetical protein